MELETAMVGLQVVPAQAMMAAGQMVTAEIPEVAVAAAKVMALALFIVELIADLGMVG